MKMEAEMGVKGMEMMTDTSKNANSVKR